MTDHYKVMGLRPGAGAVDVKKTFRKLAKEYHPDLNRHRPRWATARMRELLDAYRALSDETARALYERQYNAPPPRPKFSRREALRREATDGVGCAKLIMNDLLSDRQVAAARFYEEVLGRNPSFDLANYLSARDWLDAKFILAEEYERQSKFSRALELYEQVHLSDKAKAHYGEFFEELRERIIRICCRKLAKGAPPDQAATYYRRALAVKPTPKNAAFIHKKLAEAHWTGDRRDEALANIKRAFELDPGLKGTKKICAMMGLMESSFDFKPKRGRKHGHARRK